MKSSNKSAPRVYGLILCAGKGTRTGLCYNKILHYVGKKTVLEMTLDAFCSDRFSALVLVVAEGEQETVRELVLPYAEHKEIRMCVGGETRAQSVRNGLREIADCDIVVIHDGARPYVTERMIDDSIDSAIRHGSGIVAVPATDTIKEVRGDNVLRTLPRDNLCNVQTPQSFRYAEITDAYARVSGQYNDDAEVYERAGYVPKIVTGNYANIKITSPSDLFSYVGGQTKIGIGFDVHKLMAGLPLIIGGVSIPHSSGLLGHSDADVLTHAVMDAMLSAADCPDIGVLFPDTDPTTEGISSLLLLDKTIAILQKKGYKTGNVSAVVLAQKPKLAPHIPAIRATLAARLKVPPERVNVSATTTEHLGIVGKEEGIAAAATCLLFH